jgi:cysteine desulfurase/selenocysteine lyase
MKFGKKHAEISRKSGEDFAKNETARDREFDFVGENELYFDSACQSLRPNSVVRKMTEYYREYNSCGERVRYKWGRKVDAEVEETRRKVLKMLGLSDKDYFVSFTLNTTYGLNLILSQLSARAGFAKIITSDIEHNSPFLSSMAFAKRLGTPREVFSRNDDGSLDEADFAKILSDKSVVVMNAVSNIDARRLENLAKISRKIHERNGIFVVDAAQTMGFYSGWLRDQLSRNPAKNNPDAICFSAHKMYGPSLGVMVVKRSLLAQIETNFIGGGMVDDVRENDYDLSAAGNPEHIATIFEPGLQLYAEILGLGAAVDFISSREKSDYERIENISRKIQDFLRTKNSVHLLNDISGTDHATNIAFYSDKIDAHLLADALSEAGVMTRSGYFCVHFYLDHVKNYPPLVRLSLSFANTDADADKLIAILARAL